MNRLKLLSIMVSVFLMFAWANDLHAENDSDSAKKDINTGGSLEEKVIINTISPVMGGKVDNSTPYMVEYKNKKIGFCCSGCVEAFKADPEKYYAKLPEGK